MATGTHTAIFSRKQAGGGFSVENMDISTGARFYVGSTVTAAADNLGAGHSPDTPCATIDYAIGLCTASQGDIIYVMPGHIENVIAATGINCDVAGISIIGLGHGNMLPTISFTAAAGSVTVSQANVTIKNIRFVANFETGVTTGFTIAAGGDGLTLDGLQFRDTSATFEFLIHASIATTVTDLTIKNCRFIGAAGTLSGSLVFAGSTNNAEICNNYWYVDSSNSVIMHDAAAAVGMNLHDNCIINYDTDTAEYCAEFSTGSTGVASDNRFGYNHVDAEMWKGDAMFWFENYMSNTIAETGVVDPATTHAIP